MSKQHRGPRTEPASRTPEARAPDLELDHGNQAASEHIPPVPADAAARAFAERIALALRVPPRDPAWTERLVAVAEGSRLPDARKEQIALRLRADQATADDVVHALRTWLGRDDPELRADLVGSLEAVATGPEDRVPEQVAGRTGLPVDAVRGLCDALVLLVAFAWDEEEREAPAGDYLAEESGT